MPSYPPPPPSTIQLFLPGKDFTVNPGYVGSDVYQAILALAPAQGYGMVVVTATTAQAPSVATHPEFAYFLWVPLDTGIGYFYSGAAWVPIKSALNTSLGPLATLAVDPAKGGWVVRENLAATTFELARITDILTAGIIPVIDLAPGTNGQILSTNSLNQVVWINSNIPSLPVSIVQGGTGATTAQAAANNILSTGAPTAGDILTYKLTNWQPLHSPGGTTKYLRADGTYATPPAPTTFSQADNVTLNARQGTRLDIAHGLGSAPSQVRWVLVCTTANLTYNVNDEVDCSYIIGLSGGATAATFTAFANATNCSIWSAANTFTPYMITTGGVGAAITASCWTLKVYATL